MRRDINSDKNNNFNSEKSFHELGAQPRRSDFRAHKHVHDIENSFDDDDKSHHRHRDELNKKMVRVQLRRIERLF